MNHRPVVLLLAVLVTVGLLAGVAVSASPSPLTEPSTAVPVTQNDGDRLFVEAMPAGNKQRNYAESWVRRQRTSTVNFSHIWRFEPAAAGSDPAPPVATELTLNLFEDTVLHAELIRVETKGEGGFTWIGRVIDSPYSLVILTVREGLLIGDISTLDGHYRVRYLGGDLHVIQEIDEAALPPDAPPLLVPAPETEPEAFSPTSASDDGSMIDVLVVYTADARADNGGTAAIESLIDNYVAYTNQSYLNSGITQRLRLVHSYEADYAQGDDLHDDLRNLSRDYDDYLNEVHEYRDNYFADLVLLLVGEVKDYCGVAYLMGSVSPDFEKNAFSVMVDSCGGSTFAHELGHNMGSHHDRFVINPYETGVPAYPYGYGYVHAVPEGWCTIMAYQDECASQGYRCPNIPYWSNPDISYGGVPMGVPADQPLAADNRLSLNNTAATVANFRDTTVNGYIAGQVTSEADGSALSGIQVEVYKLQDYGVPGTPYRAAVTDADGRYDVGRLDTDSYKISFRDDFWVYLPEFYNNKPGYESADPVFVTNGSTTTVDVALAESGRIAGIVTAREDGAALEDIDVSVYEYVNNAWESYRGATTAADGRYEIGGLRKGIYRLKFDDDSGTYATEYYDNAWSVESAIDVPVTEGATTIINYQLSLAGHITGQITGEDGRFLKEIGVYAFYKDVDAWKILKNTYTWDHGEYELRGLPAGVYRIRFTDNNEEFHPGFFATEYYDNKPDIYSATDVKVRAGEVTAGINAVMGFSALPTSTATPSPTATATPAKPTKTPTITATPSKPTKTPTITVTPPDPLTSTVTPTPTVGKPTFTIRLPVVCRW